MVEGEGEDGGEVGEGEVWYGRDVLRGGNVEDDEGIWGVEGQRMILSESGQE